MPTTGNITKYRRKLFYNFFILFAGFSVITTLFQYNREKHFKKTSLENHLLAYNQIVNNYIADNNIYSNRCFDSINYLHNFFPEQNLRITLIDKKGNVLFDSFVRDIKIMENHLYRPEIQEASKKGKGGSLRTSHTTNVEYYYFAVKYNNYYIRTALPFSVKVKEYLKVDSAFIYALLLLFLIFFTGLIYFSDKLGKAISELRKFAISVASGKDIDLTTKFPSNELGDIGNIIAEVYKNLQKTKNELLVEKEKLLRHLMVLQEGIAIYDSKKRSLFANTHFIQFLNLITEKEAVTANDIFTIKELSPVISFINSALKPGNKSDYKISDTIIVEKNSRIFSIYSIVFADNNFEISINDTTKTEKEKKVKQQMTSNIAHELKTPVSSILGFLETVATVDMDNKQRQFFIERSLAQTIRLSNLIKDINLLNKIEEYSDSLKTEPVKIKDVINEVVDDLSLSIMEKNIFVTINIDDNIEINGNYSVLYSIWRNLLENTINYAGEHITVNINNYYTDSKYFYFSYSDNGKGIAEEHFSRLFERFYRVDKDRSVKSGGTGLGLSIVKNGVIFHKGEISIKKPKNGGVEFIFSLRKNQY